MSRYTAWRAFGIVIFALCRLGVILVVMRLRPRTTSCSAPQFSRLSAVRIVCNSDETPSLLEGKTIDHVREVFDSAARRLFSDDAGLWPQYRTHYCVVVLPPLSNISGDTASLGNVGISSPQPASTTMEPELLSRLAQAWHVHGILFAGHIW